MNKKVLIKKEQIIQKETILMAGDKLDITITAKQNMIVVITYKEIKLT